MDVKGIHLLERIGEGGLRVALRASFDRPGLVLLANACRLKFPGGRAQTVEDARILDALVAEFLKEPKARVSVMKALSEANGDLIARYGVLTPAELSAEISRLPEADAGRALFALGDDVRATTLAELARLLERYGAAPPPAGTVPSESIARRIEEIAIRLDQLIREDRQMGHDRQDRDDEERRLVMLLQEVAAEARAIRSGMAQRRRSASEPAPRHRDNQDRVGLFVDVQNMYYAARQLNARLDFAALMSVATRDRRLIRAIAYVVQNRDIDQSGFLAMLQQRNYEVRRKDLRVRHDGSSKGDWDMEMALDILRLAPDLDVVVLVSGDGDFSPLVTQIRTLGPEVEVYSFPGSTARELIEAADRHVPIDDGFLIRMSPSA
ncbi:MAG TPA: NYN domain-containing protein [Candidatus Polarisedimenticolia bacterium]|jgi:uncharacterized LabA/DUF88 family protein